MKDQGASGDAVDRLVKESCGRENTHTFTQSGSVFTGRNAQTQSYSSDKNTHLLRDKHFTDGDASVRVQ